MSGTVSGVTLGKSLVSKASQLEHTQRVTGFIQAGRMVRAVGGRFSSFGHLALHGRHEQATREPFADYLHLTGEWVRQISVELYQSFLEIAFNRGFDDNMLAARAGACTAFGFRHYFKTS